MTADSGHPPVHFPNRARRAQVPSHRLPSPLLAEGRAPGPPRSADSAGTATVTLWSAHARGRSAWTCPSRCCPVRWRRGCCSQAAGGPGPVSTLHSLHRDGLSTSGHGRRAEQRVRRHPWPPEEAHSCRQAQTQGFGTRRKAGRVWSAQQRQLRVGPGVRTCLGVRDPQPVVSERTASLPSAFLGSCSGPIDSAPGTRWRQ